MSRLELADIQVVLDLFHLQRESYSVEAEMIGYADIPPLKETLEDLKQCPEEFTGYYLEERLVGAISTMTDTVQVEICRMMVHPEFFRRGIASNLLQQVLQSVHSSQVCKVATGVGNTPAFRLYRKFGFQPTVEREVAPGVCIQEFIRY